MSTSDEKKKICVRTSDGEEFELNEDMAMESGYIKVFFEDFPRDTIMPLPNVRSWEMVKFIEYFNKVRELETKHGVKLTEKNDGLTFTEREKKIAGVVKEFRDENYEGLSKDDLIYLLCGACYLANEVLLQMLVPLMAERIKDMKLESWRELFGVTSDFTPQEEARNREVCSWAFEGPEIEK